MTKNPIQTLYELKQSLWYDNINRGLLENGEIARMINAGEIQGMTSNPTIFEKAIAQSNSYDKALIPLIKSGDSQEDIFYRLAVEDIQNAADLFFPLYEQTNHYDGYVSLEVSPFIANDTQKTCEDAERLWALVDRPNVLIKIPGTLEGIEAVRKTIAKGINVNITLIFSRSRYEKVIDAFMQGLEERVTAGLPVESIASIASFFVSRVDAKVEKLLSEINTPNTAQSELAASVLGKVAIANCQLAYLIYKDNFESTRWMKLKEAGAREQRPLWASTGTKNPAFRDVMYVENLIFPNTVNTVPHETLVAFKDHGNPMLSEINREKSLQILSYLDQLGISLDRIALELEIEGVKSFSSSFTSLLKTIGEKKYLKNY